MKKYMILFAVGKDRPGIVDDVSTLLFERGANIEDSYLNLEADVPAEQPIASVKAELTKLAAEMNLVLSFKK